MLTILIEKREKMTISDEEGQMLFGEEWSQILDGTHNYIELIGE